MPFAYMMYQIISYLSVEGNEPPSDVVPHPETTNMAPSGIGKLGLFGKATGAALKTKENLKIIYL